MSGFLFLFHRDGKPAHPAELDVAQQRLSHRGIHGSHSFCHQSFAFTHFHFWTTPEDDGKHQPLKDHATDTVLLFDGRLDNRSDLFERLHLNHPLTEFSDAELVQAAFLAFGEQALSMLIGPFALIWCDMRQKKALLARDPVGNRTLFYAVTPNLFAAGSEEYALLGLSNLAPEPELSSIAAYFSLQPPPENKTFFRHIFQLQPGKLLSVSPTNFEEKTFWQVDTHSHFLKPRSEESYIEEFEFLLKQAVEARCRSLNPVGLMLSGGLDSSTIAAMVNQYAKQDHQLRLKPFSYTFQNLPNSDESPAIKQICDSLQIQGTSFPADDMWPMKDWDPKAANPNGPEENLFRSLLKRIHHLAADQSCQILLSGDFGDNHFAGSHLWFQDSLRSGRWLESWQQGWLNLRHHGLRTGLRRMGLGRKSHLRPPKSAPFYLTDQAKLSWQPVTAHQRHSSIDQIRSNALFNPWSARNATAEIRATSRSGTEIRLPYADIRLISFSIRIPTYYLYRDAKKKWLLRQISANYFKNSSINFASNMNLHSFFKLGFSKEKQRIKNSLKESSKIWEPWVSSSLIFRSLENPLRPRSLNLLWWQCLTFARWYQFHWKPP